MQVWSADTVSGEKMPPVAFEVGAGTDSAHTQVPTRLASGVWHWSTGPIPAAGPGEPAEAAETGSISAAAVKVIATVAALIRGPNMSPAFVARRSRCLATPPHANYDFVAESALGVKRS
jgi:hypothetical protein